MTQPPHYPTQPPYNRQTPPAGPGYPQAQLGGPSYPPNQAFPGQPGPAYPQQTQPTNQPYPQQPATPPPPTPKNNTTAGIIITMAALLVALVIAVVYLATTKNTPTANSTPSATPTPTQTTPTPTPGRGWTINGNQLTGPTMTAQLPQGWQTTNINGASNEGDLIDPRNYNAITYWAKFPEEGSTEEVCKSWIRQHRVAQDDPVDQIPGQTWGGKPVLAYSFATTRGQRRGTLTFYCLDKGNNTTAVLRTTAWDAHKDQMSRDIQTVMSTWQWK